jgi:hypothetical protein
MIAVIGLTIGTLTESYAQRGTRRATTLEALSTHPSFFHGEEILIRTEVIGDGTLAYLVDGTTRLLLLDVPAPPNETSERLDVIGVFYDIGRLQPDDPRISKYPLGRLSESLLRKPWPGIGELPLLIASSTQQTKEPTTITLRTLVLDPKPNVSRSVTVIGRFRGRNLYADLPEAPGESPYDFVLVSVEAAVWIVGMEPKGEGFNLDVQARLDTGHWLKITGIPRIAKGMVLIEPGRIVLVDPQEESFSIPTQIENRPAPTPEIVFTAPLEGDTDVPKNTTVRIQFSRDMDPESFEEQIRIYYKNVNRVNSPVSNEPAFEVEYLRRNRVVQIRFVEELERFRSVSVELLNGITSSDGTSLAPWTFSFFVGG